MLDDLKEEEEASLEECVVKERKVKEEEEEILEDLAAISAADIDGLEAEEAERLYAEIVEYIRVTVLLLLQPGEEDDE